MSNEKNPLDGFKLRELLYLSIVVGIGDILTTTQVLHKHEALLASGGLALMALLILEPWQEKFSRALTLTSAVLSFYVFLFKLPVLLAGTLNYYVTYVLAWVLIVVFNLAILVIERKYLTSSG